MTPDLPLDPEILAQMKASKALGKKIADAMIELIGENVGPDGYVDFAAALYALTLVSAYSLVEVGNGLGADARQSIFRSFMADLTRYYERNATLPAGAKVN